MTEPQSSTETETVNLITLATHCIHATLLASKPIQSYRTKSRTKSDGTLVTDADGAAQRIIYNEIRTFDQAVRIIGEESDLEMESSSSKLHQEQSNCDWDCSAALYSDGQNKELFRQVEKNVHLHAPKSVEMETKRVSIFVDPLDGTSSYAKGYYEAVTILVAIIVDNAPVFGVIVKPFGEGTQLHCFKNTDCSVLYGGTLIGGAFVMGAEELDRSRIWRKKECQKEGRERLGALGNVDADCKRQKLIQDKGNSPDGGPSPTSAMALNLDVKANASSNLTSSANNLCAEPNGAGKENDPILSSCKRRAIISKSRAGGVVQKCIESLSSLDLIHRQPLYITGAGYKTMKLLLGEEDEALWFFPKPGTSLWDVAAADALLRVMGGRISDKFGRDLDYGKGRLEADNLDGIIACSDSILHAKCIELYKKEKWED